MQSFIVKVALSHKGGSGSSFLNHLKVNDGSLLDRLFLFFGYHFYWLRRIHVITVVAHLLRCLYTK
jgi:hypothetical protein